MRSRIRTATGYIDRVQSLRLFRFTAALVLMIASLAAPASALSHGWAHHEHESAHLDGVGIPPAPGAMSASAPDDDHAHPDVVTVTRGEGRGSALPVTDVVPVPDVKFADVASGPAGAATARMPGDPWPGPPPSLRAPPIA